MMIGFPWWSWGVLAVLVAIAELHAPGYYLIWIALGAAITAVIDAIAPLTVAGQFATFICASVVSCGGGYFVYRKVYPSENEHPDQSLNQRNRGMIGTTGIVCERFSNGYGKVRLGDSVWLAEGPDLAEGTAVVVKSVRGTRVIVELTSVETRTQLSTP